MTIQYCSDLHLEFQENVDFLAENPVKAVGEVLVLAGDIVPFGQLKHHSEFFDFVSDNFSTVYWLPGNHEYYHFDLAQKCGVLNEEIRKNVFLVNNHTVHHGDLQLIFSTLWSRISPPKQIRIQRKMNDFRLIRYNGKHFTPSDYNKLHLESKSFLKGALKKKGATKTIVVTHHVPTFRMYPKQYLGDILNEAFAVELSEMIEASRVDYWIYGHHHQAIPEFKIGNTRLVTNQLGYVAHDEHLGFKRDMSLIV